MSIRKASKLIWLISAALCCVFVLAISTHLQSQIAAKDIPEYQTPEEPPKINNAMPDNIVYWQVAQLLPQDVIIRHEEKIIPLNERLEIKQTFIRPGGKSCKIFYAASGTMAESKNIENGPVQERRHNTTY